MLFHVDNVDNFVHNSILWAFPQFSCVEKMCMVFHTFFFFRQNLCKMLKVRFSSLFCAKIQQKEP